MLDYAANGVAYWPVEEIRTKFEIRCEKEGTEPEDVLSKRPKIQLGLSVGPDSLNRFLSAFDWALSELRHAQE